MQAASLCSLRGSAGSKGILMANSTGKGDGGAASADSVVVRVQFNDEWIVRFHVGSSLKNFDPSV